MRARNCEQMWGGANCAECTDNDLIGIICDRCTAGFYMLNGECKDDAACIAVGGVPNVDGVCAM